MIAREHQQLMKKSERNNGKKNVYITFSLVYWIEATRTIFLLTLVFRLRILIWLLKLS